MKLFRLQKTEKGHNNSLQIYTSLLQKEKSSQFLVSTVGRRSNNRLTLQYRTLTDKDSKAYNADCLRMRGNVLHFRPSKPGQPKPRGNDARIDHPEMDMKSVTS